MISLYQAMGTSLFDDSCWPQHMQQSHRRALSRRVRVTVAAMH